MPKYNLITTKAQLSEVASHYEKVDAFTFDVETMGDHRGDPWRNRVTWLALATEGRVDVIPMGHPNGDFIRLDYPLLPSAAKRAEKGLPLREADYSKDIRKATRVFDKPPTQLLPADVWAALKPAFMRPSEKSGHNLGFDLQSVNKYLGGLPQGPYFCTMWASHILDSRNSIRLGLDDCLMREFKYKMVKGVGKEVEAHSFKDVADYAALDAEWTWKLYKHLKARLKAEGGGKAMRLDMQILPVTCAMELEGTAMMVDDLQDLKDRLEEDIEHAKAAVFAAAGKAFPINSNAVKQQLLWGPKNEGGRGLRPKVLTPGGKVKFRNNEPVELKDWAVSAEALEHYRDIDPLATALLEYADLNKLMTTYVIPYLGGEIERTTAGKTKTVKRESLLDKGRIHTRFAPLTETGRFSSRSPNLQNVPNASTENGKAIRNLFGCDDDEVLVVADYSQIEPRVTASVTGDQRLIAGYLAGQDVYTTIADPFGLPRKAGKVLFLALSYGVGPDKISASLGIPLHKAKELLKDFEVEFATIYQYKARLVKIARAQKPVPYVQTLVGRRRYLPDLKSDYYGPKSRAERQAFNTVIQGSAADLMKMAMVRANVLIPDEASLLLTVHDELVTKTKKHKADETAEAIREAMEGIHALKVPLIADVKIVDRWGEAK